VAFDDATGSKFEPALATAWRQVDPVTWEFTLRPGVRFSNGEAFNAQAVKYNVDRMLSVQEPLLQHVKTRLPTVNGASVVNEGTVRITTAAPDPIFLNRITTFLQVPPAATAAFSDRDALIRASVGTGPYRVAEYVPTQRQVFEAVESWRPRGPARQIVVTPIPENATKIAGLKTGELDLITGFTNDQATSLRAEGYEVVGRAMAIINLIEIQTAPNIDNPFKDVRARQAANYAVDKEGIARALWASFAKVAPGQLATEDTNGYNPAIRAYPFDQARARALLAEAGLSQGFTVTDHTTVAYRTLHEAAAGFLAQVGIRVDLKQIESAQLVQEHFQGPRPPMFVTRTETWELGDLDRVYAPWSNLTEPGTQRMNDPQFNDIYARQRVEMDPARRTQLLQQLGARFHELAPVIFMNQDVSLWAAGKKVTGLKPSYNFNPGWSTIVKTD
jgi:peptide/nickel transport system substrate-binding protein